MQTKRQVQQLLTSAGTGPHRRFGQNFLVDLNLARLLLDSAGIGPDDVVLEVGPGTGSLTEALAQRAGSVVAVEIDRTLAQIVQSQLAEAGNVKLIQDDALSRKGMLNPKVSEALTAAQQQSFGRLLLVANLPYDVASALMLNLVKGPVVADEIVVTVQKEVGDRMAAGPSSKDYGILSVLLGATGTVEILRVLKPSVFWPPPKVNSAIVRFVRREEKCRQIDDMTVFGDVASLFLGHRRKMLRACAKRAGGALASQERWMELFERCQIDPTHRPEQLSPAQYVQLANFYHRHNRSSD